METLCEQKGLPKFKIFPDVSTRWNSTYLMIERANKLRQPIMELCAKRRDLQHLIMTEQHWDCLTQVTQLLKKFHEATLVVSSAQDPNGPAIIPTSEWLEPSVKRFTQTTSGTLKTAAQAALLKLVAYRPKLEENKSAFMCVVLNPTLKLNYFKEHKWDSKKVTSIRNFVVAYFKQNYMGMPEDVDALSEDSDDEDGLLAFMHKRKKTAQASVTETEIEKYLSEPLADAKVDVLKWWAMQGLSYPKLSVMAMDFLSVQASSVDNERDFSGGVDLLPPTRHRLKNDAIQACMCLKSWLKDFYDVESVNDYD